MAVSFDCAHFAANLLERLYVKNLQAPHLVPGADGSLQIEWHINQYDLEIDVLGPFDVVASRFDILTEKMEEIEIESDFTELASWLRTMSKPRQ